MTEIGMTKIVPPRILVTGSREYSNRKTIGDALLAAWKELAALRYPTLNVPSPLIVIHGGCRGADVIAGEWATTMRNAGLPVIVEIHPADWNTYGKSAGHRRNQEMVDTKPDLVLAFPLGESPGTRSCIRMAERARLPVVIFEAASV